MKPVFDLKNVYRIRHKGVIDADGHILEPANLWEDYIEAKYRDRALRLKQDEEGLEYLEINGKPSQLTAHGFPATLGRMGDREMEDFQPHPDRVYMGEAPYGSMNAEERLNLLDAEGVEASILYPTLGILWEAECDDAEISQAYCRAYNRWIADFCRDSGGRLIPIAHLSLGDPEAAANELERAVKDGCRGAFVVTFTIHRRPHGDPAHDPVFAKAQELGVPIAIHPSFEPPDLASRRFVRLNPDRNIWSNPHPLLQFAAAGDGCRHAFTTFFDYAVFDRFPDLKVVVLESGAGWIGYWMNRLDGVYETTVVGTNMALREKPSEYFKRQCWISADPDETTIAGLTKEFGADRFFWASDYPHPDHTADYLEALEHMVEPMDEKSRTRVLGANAREVYGI